MTVVVGVAAPDGIILAADSRTTLQWETGGRHRIMSDTTQKVFAVSGRIGVATYGNAFIGNRTIAGLMDEFVAQRSEQMPESADAVATVLGDFFHERFQTDSPPELLAWGRRGGAGRG
jgi:20S proteasome alpha/beta subunit